MERILKDRMRKDYMPREKPGLSTSCYDIARGDDVSTRSYDTIRVLIFQDNGSPKLYLCVALE